MPTSSRERLEIPVAVPLSENGAGSNFQARSCAMVASSWHSCSSPFRSSTLNIPLERFINMFGRVGTLVADRYYPPDVEYVLDKDYLSSVFDTIKMAYLGALFGMAFAIPLGWFGAYNMTPSRRFLYPVARLMTIGARGGSRNDLGDPVRDDYRLWHVGRGPGP